MSQCYDERGYKTSRAPMEYVDAVGASRLASQDQDNAKQFLSDKAKEFADAEREYRKALSERIVELRDSGTAVTAAGDIARGDCSDLKHARDLAEGMLEVARQSLWRHTADRRDLEQFLDWSKRASFLDSMPRSHGGSV